MSTTNPGLTDETADWATEYTVACVGHAGTPLLSWRSDARNSCDGEPRRLAYRLTADTWRVAPAVKLIIRAWSLTNAVVVRPEVAKLKSAATTGTDSKERISHSSFTSTPLKSQLKGCWH